jgi:hypothetical protein
MALFQSPGNVPLFIVISSSHARYGIVASPPIFNMSPGTRLGPTDLFFPIPLILLLIVLISIVKGLVLFHHCICGVLSLQLNIVGK